MKLYSTTFFAFTVLSQCAAVDEFVNVAVSYKNGVDVGIAQPFGRLNGALQSVQPSQILGAPLSGRFMCLPLNAEVVFSISQKKILDGVKIYTVLDGAWERVEVFGRNGSSNPWTSLGTVQEAAVSGSLNPIGYALPLPGDLPEITQIMVRGLDNGGTFPGFDLMAVQGLGVAAVPEPASLLGFAAGALAFIRVRKNSQQTRQSA